MVTIFYLAGKPIPCHTREDCQMGIHKAHNVSVKIAHCNRLMGTCEVKMLSLFLGEMHVNVKTGGVHG